jgi:hypothetical protein
MTFYNQGQQVRELAPSDSGLIPIRLKEYPEQGGVVGVVELMLRLRVGPRNKKDAPLAGESRNVVETDIRDVGEIIDRSVCLSHAPKCFELRWFLFVLDSYKGSGWRYERRR